MNQPERLGNARLRADKSLGKSPVLRVACLALAVMLSQGTARASQDMAAGEKFLIQVWRTDEGLPQNSVTSIVQTRDGYLWLATFNGLVRFDGVRFRVFDTHNTPEFRNSRMVRLFEDHKGSLWIGTEGGGLYELREGRMIAHDLGPEFQVGHAMTITEDPQGGIWVFPAPGVLRRFYQGRVTLHSDELKIDDKGQSFITTDAAGKLWVATRKKLAFWDGGRFQDAGDLAGGRLGGEFIAPSPRGGVWVAAGKHLRRFDGGKWLEDLGEHPWANEIISALLEDRKGRVWVGTFGRGLYCYETNGLVQSLTTRDGLSRDRVRSLCEDREGDIWVGTDSGGLCRLKPRRLEAYGQQQGLSEEVATSICGDSAGNIWVGSYGGGLYRFKENRFVRDGEGLTSGYIQSVFEDRQKTLWVGTFGRGLFRKAGGTFRQAVDPQLIGDVVNVIFQDSKGRLWVGTQKGAACFAEGKWTVFTPQNGFPARDILCMAEDHAGVLWLGSSRGGLIHYEGGLFRCHKKEDGLPSDEISALYCDHEGVLWVGTYGAGLVRYRHGRFVQYRHPEGLGPDVVSHVTEDARGNLWIGSFEGIFHIAKAALDAFDDTAPALVQFIGYGKEDGMLSRECNARFQPAGWTAPDGRLYFPTIRGLVIAGPFAGRTAPPPPPVIIESIVIDGGVQAPSTGGPLPGRLSGPDGANSFTLDTWRLSTALRVPPGHRQYEFHYTGLNYAGPERVQFQYMLEGLDKGWVDAGERRTAFYSHIPAGHYRFHVKARNNDGVWNDTGASLAVVVVPAFWQTWWFLSASFLVLTGGVAGVARYVSTKKLQRKLALLRQQQVIEIERTRIARDMHDELGSKLTKISFLSEVAKRNLEQRRETEQQIESISRTSRDVMRSLDEIVWAVNPRNDSLENLAAYIGQYAQEYLHTTGVECELEIPTELPSHPYSTDVRHNLFLAVHEALSNVLKHASASRVRVRMTASPAVFQISVEDDGCGFDASKPAAGGAQGGNGLRNMRQRLTEIGADFDLDSRPGHGTRVLFTLHLNGA